MIALGYHAIIESLVMAVINQIKPLSCLNEPLIRIIIDFVFPSHGKFISASFIRKNYSYYQNSLSEGCTSLFRLCVRKRPLLDWEIARNDYSVVSTSQRNNVSTKLMTISMHEGKLARNGRQLSMMHHTQWVDRVWLETSSNRRVCEEEVAPLLSYALSGNAATLLCFGQTGTGSKNFSLN